MRIFCSLLRVVAVLRIVGQVAGEDIGELLYAVAFRRPGRDANRGRRDAERLFKDVTGKRAGRGFNAYTGKADGPFLRFAREVCLKIGIDSERVTLDKLRARLKPVLTMHEE